MDWNKIVSGCYKDVTDATGKVIGKDVASLNCIPAVFQNVVTAALVLAGIVAVFMIIFAGIKFITSGGDPKQVEAARHTLTWAVVGLILILLSFFIINLIGSITGTSDILKNFGFPEKMAPLPSGGGGEE